MEWISVKDRLPEDYIDGVVAIYCCVKKSDNKRSFCRFYEKYWKTDKPEFVCIKNGKITDIIYWMPLPEPPKEKGYE